MRISDWSSDVCSSDLDLLQQGIDGEGRRSHRARIRATCIRTCRGEVPNPHPALRASLSRKQERGWNRAGTDKCPRAGKCEFRRPVTRSEEHTSELQSLMRISYAVFCLKKKN